MRINPAVGKKSKTYKPSQGRNAQKNAGHQEVDLVPIMNLFVTLIPMLLSMVVLVSIAYISLDLSNPNAPGAGEASTAKKTEKKAPQITKLELIINKDDTGEIFIFNKNGEIDPDQPEILVSNFHELYTALSKYKKIMLEDKSNNSESSENADESLSIIILPKEYVRFGVFVKTMDLCKKMNFSDIMISEI